MCGEVEGAAVPPAGALPPCVACLCEGVCGKAWRARLSRLLALSLHPPPHPPTPPQPTRLVHLHVDVSFSSGPQLAISAYAAPPNNFQRSTVFTFQQLRACLVAGAEERVAIDAMTKAALGACWGGVGGG